MDYRYVAGSYCCLVSCPYKRRADGICLLAALRISGQVPSASACKDEVPAQSVLAHVREQDQIGRPHGERIHGQTASGEFLC